MDGAPASAPAVTVVIPNWNRGDLLAPLLDELHAQTRPPEEIIVVDNGSTDESCELARRAGARVISLPANLGFARAVNAGVEEAHTGWILILNNDVSLPPSWLETLLASAISQQAWFATGKLVRHDRPSILDATFDAVCRGGCAWRCGSERPDSPLWSEPRVIHLAPLTAGLFRRELFHRAGLLDPRFESYLEDVEFGLRCAAQGFRGIYEPAATASHRGSATLGAWNKDTVRRMARNQVFLAAKHFKGTPRWPIVVAHVLWGLLALRRGRGLAWLRGKFEALAAIRKQGWQDSASSEQLWAAIQESELLILELQKRTGFDWYWKAYFLLAGCRRERA